MGTVQRLFERFGFVRLREFGLILTPDRRVLTARSKILDDGYGQCIVGWRDSDLATMELAAWGTEPAQPQVPKPIAKPAATTAVTPKPATRAAATRPPDPPQPPQPDEHENEDEWEWQIAVARARAASAVLAPPEPRLVRGTRPQLPATTPARAAITTAIEADDADEWEWEIAAARVGASVADVSAHAIQAPRGSQRSFDTAVTTVHAEACAIDSERTIVEAKKPVLFTETTVVRTIPPANDPPRPRTIVPVPALPRVDPRLVRTYEAPHRFPRATDRHVVRPTLSRAVRR